MEILIVENWNRAQETSKKKRKEKNRDYVVKYGFGHQCKTVKFWQTFPINKSLYDEILYKKESNRIWKWMFPNHNTKN